MSDMNISRVGTRILDVPLFRPHGFATFTATAQPILLVTVELEGGVTGFGKVSDATASFPNGCHIAEVEIDRETGRVSLERYTLVDDFEIGRASCRERV